MNRTKRKRGIPLYVWVSQDEYDTIRQRMEEAGIQNLSAYIRKMALNGYILHVDLSPSGSSFRCDGAVQTISIRLPHTPTPMAYTSLKYLHCKKITPNCRVSDMLKQLAAVVKL